MKGNVLYRSTSNKRIAGVCGGLADYFGIETWLVRILVVTAFFLLAGPFVIVAYIAAWFILDKRPDSVAVDTHNVVSMGNTGKGWYHTDSSKIEIKQKVWQAGQTPKQALNDVSAMFADTERRLRAVETYVTSSTFKLNAELDKL